MSIVEALKAALESEKLETRRVQRSVQRKVVPWKSPGRADRDTPRAPLTPRAPDPGSLLQYPGEALETALLRFAVARKHKLPAALDMVRAHLAWAKELDLPALRRCSAAEVLGVAPERVRDLDAAFPHFSVGHDLEGRPVTYIHGVNYAAAQLFAQVSPERVTRYHVWRTERALALMYRRLVAGETPQPPGNLTAVISVAGMTMRHVDKHFLALIKLLAVVDQNHYPERLGKMYIVGVSRLFFVVWRMVRPWLDAHTASKIAFLTLDDLGKLQEAIAPQQLPSAYGGSAACPWADELDADEGGEATPPGTPGAVRRARSSSPAPRDSLPHPHPLQLPAIVAMRRSGAAAHGHRSGASGEWGSQGSLSFNAPSPLKAHARGHSRSGSADFSASARRSGAAHRRGISNDDALSMYSFASAVSFEESDSEFFDAVDLYVDIRLAELEESATGEKAGLPLAGALPAAPLTQLMLPPGTPRLSVVPPRRARRNYMSTELGLGPAAAPVHLPPIPERAFKEVKGRLTRVRMLLDATNVLTLITSIALLTMGDGDSPLTPQGLRAFGGAIMSVSIVSLLLGLTVFWSASSLCCFWREWRTPAVQQEELEGEDAV